MTFRILYCLLAALCSFNTLYSQEWEHEIDHVDIELASFNEESSNYCPVYYNNGLLFTSTRGNKQLFQKKDPITGQVLSLLFYVERIDSNTWGKVKPIQGEISRYIHYGPASVNAPGDKIYFTRNNDEKKLVELTNNLGIQIADFKDGTITNTKAFEYNHSRFDFGQPSISRDGQKLYFVANIPSGYGGTDLYMSKFTGGKWSAPTNLGRRINTGGDELYPFIDINDRLYFSSDGRAGNGGLDIFYTEEFNGRLIEPVPLHPAFNSEADDFGIVMDSSGFHGFFSSNRVWENDTDQIFEFQIHQYWPQFEKCVNLSEKQYCYTFYEKSLEKEDSLIFVYEWDFGDGNKTKGFSANHCFDGPGSYKIQLSVLDTISKTEAMNVADYALEVLPLEQVIITSPDTVKVGTPFNMYGAQTNIKNFYPKAYYWHLGDNKRIRGDATGITFDAEGEFQVELGVIGLNGKGKERKYCASKMISVIK